MRVSQGINKVSLLRLPLKPEHSIWSVVNNQSPLAEPNGIIQGIGEAIETICLYSLYYIHHICSLYTCIYIYAYINTIDDIVTVLKDNQAFPT